MHAFPLHEVFLEVGERQSSGLIYSLLTVSDGASCPKMGGERERERLGDNREAAAPPLSWVEQL